MKFKITVILACILLILSGISSLKEPAKERMIKKAAWHEIQQKALISPSTAKLVDSKILEQDKYGRYLVYLEVDSQNVFGAMIRGKFYVVLSAVNYENYTFTYKTSTNSYISINDPSTGLTTLNMSPEQWIKQMNNWGKPDTTTVEDSKG